MLIIKVERSIEALCWGYPLYTILCHGVIQAEVLHRARLVVFAARKAPSLNIDVLSCCTKQKEIAGKFKEVIPVDCDNCRSFEDSLLA